MLEWALHRQFAGEEITSSKMQGQLERVWQNLITDSLKKKAKNRRSVLLSLSGIASRAYKFVLQHRVILPVTHYQLRLVDTVIVGRYAVIQNLQDRKRVDILYTSPVADISGYPPDFVLMARWLHFSSQRPGQLVGVTRWNLLNQQVFSQGSMQTPLVRQYLSSILIGIRENRFYPSPGLDCVSCPTKSCFEVFK